MSCANWKPANFRASPTNFALHGDLDTFVRQGPHATQELPKLPKALGINEKPWRGRRRWFFATWNGSVRRAHKRLHTARISRPQPLINTIRSTASMHRQSTRWTRTLRSRNAILSLGKERPASWGERRRCQIAGRATQLFLAKPSSWLWRSVVVQHLSVCNRRCDAHRSFQSYVREGDIEAAKCPALSFLSCSAEKPHSARSPALPA